MTSFKQLCQPGSLRVLAATPPKSLQPWNWPRLAKSGRLAARLSRIIQTLSLPEFSPDGCHPSSVRQRIGKIDMLGLMLTVFLLLTSRSLQSMTSAKGQVLPTREMLLPTMHWAITPLFVVLDPTQARYITWLALLATRRFTTNSCRSGFSAPERSLRAILDAAESPRHIAIVLHLCDAWH
jgi:hypothetical protein